MGGTAAAAAASVSVLLVLTVLQVLLGELVPKAIALRHPERVIIGLTPPMLLSVRILAPFIAFFNGSSNVLLRAGGFQGSDRHAHVHAPEEIELLVTESGDAGALDPEERRLLHNALDLGELVARQVMVPRNQLVLGPAEATTEELLQRIADTPYAALPVYRDTPDTVIGVVDMKDLHRLDVAGQTSPASAVKPVAIVPESAPASSLWDQLVHGDEPMAVVIDEYGGTAGVVTRR